MFGLMLLTSAVNSQQRENISLIDSFVPESYTCLNTFWDAENGFVTLCTDPANPTVNLFFTANPNKIIAELNRHSSQHKYTYIHKGQETEHIVNEQTEQTRQPVQGESVVWG